MLRCERTLKGLGALAQVVPRFPALPFGNRFLVSLNFGAPLAWERSVARFEYVATEYKPNFLCREGNDCDHGDP
jgi:hypothetical protein